MKAQHPLGRWLLAMVVGLVLFFTPRAVPAESPSAGPVLDVFVREGCPHCAAAEVYLQELQQAHPALEVRRHQIEGDPRARRELQEISRRAGIRTPGVPTFVIGDTVLVGFDGPAGVGRQLEDLVRAHGRKQRAPAPIRAGPLAHLDVSRLGLPLFTLALGLLDGFNPCAMWVLLFLLSLLVHWHDRRRLALVIGLVNLRDARRPGERPVLAIPEKAKPGLYGRMRGVLQTQALAPALAGVALLAVVVNLVELLCTAGLPALYTAVLSQQALPAWGHYAYLGLYILGYIADDALMVGLAVWALGNRRLSEAAGSRLKGLSGAVMLALGLVLLLRPGWLI